MVASMSMYQIIGARSFFFTLHSGQCSISFFRQWLHCPLQEEKKLRSSCWNLEKTPTTELISSLYWFLSFATVSLIRMALIITEYYCLFKVFVNLNLRNAVRALFLTTRNVCVGIVVRNWLVSTLTSLVNYTWPRLENGKWN